MRLSDAQQRRWERYQNAAHRLNGEAYNKFGLVKVGKSYQFHPCAKSLVYIEACNRGCDEPTMVVTQQAALEPCRCHTDLTVTQLLDYEFDASWRHKHYQRADIAAVEGAGEQGP